MGLENLFALSTSAPVIFVGGVVVGALGMLFGKVLPWRTEHARLQHQISLDRLKMVEQALDADVGRASRLLRGFKDEPEVPADAQSVPEHVRAIFDYQRERSRIGAELPELLTDIKSTREQVLSLRQRLLGDPKTPVDKALARIDTGVAENERRLNQIIEDLTNMPRFHISSSQPDPSMMSEGDFWFVSP